RLADDPGAGPGGQPGGHDPHPSGPGKAPRPGEPAPGGAGPLIGPGGERGPGAEPGRPGEDGAPRPGGEDRQDPRGGEPDWWAPEPRVLDARRVGDHWVTDPDPDDGPAGQAGPDPHRHQPGRNNQPGGT